MGLRGGEEFDDLTYGKLIGGNIGVIINKGTSKIGLISKRWISMTIIFAYSSEFLEETGLFKCIFWFRIKLVDG